MKANNRYFNLGGMKIAFIDLPEIMNYVVGKAFSLSEIDHCDADVTFKGVMHYENTFIENMPPEIYEEFKAMGEMQEPCFFEGQDGRFFLVVKNMGSASYAITSPPFTHVDVCCQAFKEEKLPLHLQVILIPMISHLMLMQGKFLMHAGCVATPEGEGVVLMADSGGGKTTSVFTLTCNGFNFLSDDMVVAAPSAEGFEFIPIQEKMNVTNKTISFFPELKFAKKLLKQVDETKLPVHPGDVFGKNKLMAKAHASTIIFLRLGKEGPKLEPLEGSTILKPLLKSNTFARYQNIPQVQIETIWNLLEKTKIFALYTGHDPHALGRWMAEQAVNGVLVQNPSKKLAGKSKKKSIWQAGGGGLSAALRRFLPALWMNKE